MFTQYLDVDHRLCSPPADAQHSDLMFGRLGCTLCCLCLGAVQAWGCLYVDCFSVAVFRQCAGCMRDRSRLLDLAWVCCSDMPCFPFSRLCGVLHWVYVGILSVCQGLVGQALGSGVLQGLQVHSGGPQGAFAGPCSRVCWVGLLCISSISTICVARISLTPHRGSSCGGSCDLVPFVNQGAGRTVHTRSCVKRFLGLTSVCM